MSIPIESDQERFKKQKEPLEIDKLFRALVKLEGSDLHLKVDRPPLHPRGRISPAHESGAHRRR